MSQARNLWAKSSTVGGGHSLLAHMLDVGIVAKRLIAEPRLQVALKRFAGDLRFDIPDAARLIVILAALHDIGKASPCFQQKWPPGAPVEAMSRSVDDIPHATISGYVIKQWLRDLGMHTKEAETLANAVSVHHGPSLPMAFDRSLGTDLPAIGDTPWNSWRSELIEEVVRAFGPIPTFDRNRGYRTALSWAFMAGVTSVADWIGSGLPHTDVVDDVHVYLLERDEAVESRLGDIHWPSGDAWWNEPDRPERFSSWFGGTPVGHNPRALQLAVEQAMAELDGEPGLIVIEAPMGEGKTEAAFFAAVRSAAPGGTYFGMPTQATSDAMHARLHDFVARNNRRDVSISLAHGSARLLAQTGTNSGVLVVPSLAPEADVNREPADGPGIEAAAVQVQWFSMGRKELLSELGVGTIDQALQGVLPTKHHFVKLWALAGKVVVLDEVHAFDEYTTGLVEELVRWLAAMGSTVIVMSATLPESTRLALASAYRDGIEGDETAGVRADYPRLTLVSPVEVRTISFAATRRSTLRVQAAPFAVDKLVELIGQLRRGGGAVGVVVNRVSRAQELYQICRDQEMKPLLLHARMPLAERKEREEQLLSLYGPKSTGKRDGLVIATQVIEQSLDVDFDVLVTDLAPVDLLFQRSGRAHRHAARVERGAHAEPVLHIAGLGSLDTGPEEDATDAVYDPYLMWRTWSVLAGAEQVSLPDDIDSLVQTVYRTDEELAPLEPYREKMSELAHRLRTKTKVKRNEAGAWLAASPADVASEAWKVTATDSEEAARGRAVAPTRLGDRSVAVVPVYRTPAGWTLPNASGVSVAGSGRVPRRWAQSALMSQISVRNADLIARLESAQKPDWWERQKPLRFLLPLELDEAGTSLVDPNVRLDSELGLVISRGRR